MPKISKALRRQNKKDKEICKHKEDGRSMYEESKRKKAERIKRERLLKEQLLEGE